MVELARHSRPSDESPETIVREKEKVEVSTENVGRATYVTIERLTNNRFGSKEFEQTGGGTLER